MKLLFSNPHLGGAAHGSCQASDLHTHEEVGVVTFITCCSCNLFLQEYSHAKTTHPTLETQVHQSEVWFLENNAGLGRWLSG